MPSSFTYPGVYVEEIPSPVHPIMGVSTSVAAFVDVFTAGPMNQPVQITSMADFARTFGGISMDSEASYAIQQFFLNGGQTAWVVRVAPVPQDAHGQPQLPQPAQLQLQEGSPANPVLGLEASSPGAWGKSISVAAADVPGSQDASGHETFNLYVQQKNDQGQVVGTETYRNLSMTPGDPNFVVDVVNHQSALVRVQNAGLGHVPFGVDVTPSGGLPARIPFQPLQLAAGQDLPSPRNANPVDMVNALVDPNGIYGIYALDRIDPFIFNILCLPAAANLNAGSMKTVVDAAAAYCRSKRAMLIVDIPRDVQTPAGMTQWRNDPNNAPAPSENAAVYFPRLEVYDPITGRPRNVGACGTMAGVWARTDATRGVWKAPAGTQASLIGANLARHDDGTPIRLTDLENGELNPQGINVLRNFPIFGNVSWGARTLAGADQQASEWKYIPVRRTAYYIEESLYQGLKWVVFEPNDEPLWSQIRLNVGAFMHDLFRQGAFQGTTAQDAYFVKCDKDTTTQNDIDRGIVNIVVGFAPLKPAEFVVIQLQQMTGQIQT